MSVYEIEKILIFAHVLKFQRDEYIIRDGEIGNDFFVILTGSAKVIKVIEKKELELAVLNSGMIFGEMAFISEEPRTADIIATEPLQCLRFTQSTINKLLKNMPEVSSKFLLNLSLVLCDRLRDVNLKLLELTAQIDDDNDQEKLS